MRWAEYSGLITKLDHVLHLAMHSFYTERM